MTTKSIFKSADQTAPAIDAVAVTPSDVALLPGGSCDAIYIGAGGTLTIMTASGNSILFVGLQTGSLLPVRAKQVFATGTTASSIVALY